MRVTKQGEKHFTASVWLITHTYPKRVLLLHHKKLNSWMQPGGHLEPFENPIEAAVREVHEETQIDLSQLNQLIQDDQKGTKYLPLPKYFLEETIPPSKYEPAHFHLDMMYVVEINVAQFRISESEDLKWFTKEDALKLTLFVNTKKIIEELL